MSFPREVLGELASNLRPPRGAFAAAFVDELARVSKIADQQVRHQYFELGSLTKTFMGVLVAALVLDGAIELDSTTGELLGDSAGLLEDVSLRELATHTSGLPSLPPNAITVPFWPRDPYRFYGARQLRTALSRCDLRGRGSFSYSNFGYMVLGCCLSAKTRRPVRDLLTQYVFTPVGMRSARCQPCSGGGLLKGYGSLTLGGRRWHERLPGAGGVDGTIADLASWVSANVHLGDDLFAQSLRMAQEVHFQDGDLKIGLSWRIQNGVHWHNGATGRYQSVIAFRPGRTGVVALASESVSDVYRLDAKVMDWFSSNG